MKKLFNLNMNDLCPFVSHISEFNTIVDQLVSVGTTFDDEVQPLLILSQLPDSWQGTITKVSNSDGKKN